MKNKPLISIQCKYADCYNLLNKIIYIRPLIVNESNKHAMKESLLNFFMQFGSILGIEIYIGYAYIVFDDIHTVKNLLASKINFNSSNILLSHKNSILFADPCHEDTDLEIILKKTKTKNKIINLYITILSNKIYLTDIFDHEKLCCVCYDKMPTIVSNCCKKPRVCIYCCLQIIDVHKNYLCPICRSEIQLNELYYLSNHNA